MLQTSLIPVGNGRSSSYFENTALFPLTDLFQRMLRFHAEDTPDEKLGKLEHWAEPVQTSRRGNYTVVGTAPVLLLCRNNCYPLLNLSNRSGNAKRHSKLSSPSSWNLLKNPQPILFILEDLHWTDPTTLELLNLVIEQYTDRPPVSTVLTSLVPLPTDVESPLLFDGDHSQSLITSQGGTNRYTNDRWENLPPRGAPADHCQDGWRAIIC